jgi:predicted GNAT family N-acyltransferase
MLTLKWFMGDKEDLSEVYAIRREVFCEEQGFSEEDEFDGTDGECVHLLIYEGDLPVSTGRIYIGDEFKLGRIATIMTHRGRGIASGLIEALVGACVKMGGNRQIIHAQVTARSFYEKLGFVACSEVFMEAGAAHVAMEHFGDMKKCGGGNCAACGMH